MRLSLYLSVDCGSIIMGNSCWLWWLEDFTVCSCCQFWHAVIMVYICWRFCYRVIMLYRCWIYTFTWTSWCGSVTNPMLAYVVMVFSVWERCYETICQDIIQSFYTIQLPARLMQIITAVWWSRWFTQCCSAFVVQSMRAVYPKPTFLVTCVNGIWDGTTKYGK